MAHERSEKLEAKLIDVMFDIETYIRVIQSVNDTGQYNGFDEDTALNVVNNRLTLAIQDLQKVQELISTRKEDKA